MIVTVTPNPSLDLLYEADGLVFDDANRLDEPRRRPGGQGINAARAVQRLGGRAIAVALLGGGSGREIAETLVAEGTSLVEVRAKMPTRLFVAVHDRSDGRNLLLNERGPARDADEADGLFAAAMDATRAHAPAWVAGCGSLPPGFPDDWYARLAHAAREAGAKVAIDCDGRALRLAAEYCDLLVPIVTKPVACWESNRLHPSMRPPTRPSRCWPSVHPSPPSPSDRRVQSSPSGELSGMHRRPRLQAWPLAPETRSSPVSSWLTPMAV